MGVIPPHLAARPVWHGLPVPYINCWGAEVDEHAWRLMHDPIIDRMAWFTAEALMGEGRAYLAKQNLQRQREVAVKGLCQVCRRGLIPGPRWLLVSGSTAGFHTVTGVGEDELLVSEPWLCRRCLTYTLSTCPGIKRRMAIGDLTVVLCERWELVVSTGWHDDHGPDVRAAMWVKIRPLTGHPFRVDVGGGRVGDVTLVPA